MSLSALPTELDVLIFDYLSTQEQSWLSRVSKAYYKTGTPLLYHSLRFHNDEVNRVTHLLMTLLRRRRGLSKHIENFHVLLRDTKTTVNEISKNKDTHVQLKSHAKLIKLAIEHSGVPNFEKINWSQRSILPNPKFDYVLALTVRLVAERQRLRIGTDVYQPIDLNRDALYNDLLAHSPNISMLDSLRDDDMFNNHSYFEVASTQRFRRLKSLSR